MTSRQDGSPNSPSPGELAAIITVPIVTVLTGVAILLYCLWKKRRNPARRRRVENFDPGNKNAMMKHVPPDTMSEKGEVESLRSIPTISDHLSMTCADSGSRIAPAPSAPPAWDPYRSTARKVPTDDAFFDSSVDAPRSANASMMSFPVARDLTGMDSRQRLINSRTSPQSSTLYEEVRARIAGEPQRMLYRVFRGREPEYDKLKAMLLCRDAKFVTVVGRGGMGKTCLTLRVLYDLEKEPGVSGIVYAGCRTSGSDLGTLCALSSMALPEASAHSVALRDLAGVSGGMPARELSERMVAIISSAVAMRDTPSAFACFIIFVDNIEDIQSEDGQLLNHCEELVEAVAQSRGRVRLVVTTRLLVTLHPQNRSAVEQLVLESGLAEAEGMAVLQDLDSAGDCGLRDARPDALRELVRATHGVPRAMEVVVSMLAADPFLNPDTVLSRLRGELASSDDLIAALVKDAFGRLDATGCQIMEALAVFNSPVPMAAIEHVLGLSHHDVNQALRKLARVHQVQVDRGTSRVSIHALDVTFALSQLTLERRTRLHRAAAAYYRSIETYVTDYSASVPIENILSELKHLVAAGDYEEAASGVARVSNDRKCYLAGAWPTCMPVVGLVLSWQSHRYAEAVLSIIQNLRLPDGKWRVTDAGLTCELETYAALLNALLTPRGPGRFKAAQALMGGLMRARQVGRPETIATVCAVVGQLALVFNLPCEENIRIAEPAFTYFSAVLRQGAASPERDKLVRSPVFRSAATWLCFAAAPYYLSLAHLGRIDDARKAVESCATLLETLSPDGAPVGHSTRMRHELAVHIGEGEKVIAACTPVVDAIAMGCHPVKAVEEFFSADAMRTWSMLMLTLLYLIKALVTTRSHPKVAVAVIEAFVELPQVQFVVIEHHWSALCLLVYMQAQRLRHADAAVLALHKLRVKYERKYPDRVNREILGVLQRLVDAVRAADAASEYDAILMLLDAVAVQNAPFGPDPQPHVFREDADALRSVLQADGQRAGGAAGAPADKEILARMAKDRRQQNKCLFVSYGRSDVVTPLAKKLTGDLIARGFSVWIDEEILPGENFPLAIGKALQRCDGLVALIDQKYTGSDYCKDELHLAKAGKKAIFPCLLEDVNMEADLKYLLVSVNWIRFDVMPYPDALEKLIAGMEGEGVRRQWSPFHHAFYPKPRRLAIVALLSLVARDAKGAPRHRSVFNILPLPAAQRLLLFTAMNFDLS